MTLSGVKERAQKGDEKGDYKTTLFWQASNDC